MSRRRAFTLLEVLVAIAIVAVLLAIIWPDFGAMQRGEQLPESAYRMKALIAMCRAEAMNQARRFQVTFRQDGNVRVYVQEDPILAPQSFIACDRDWARGPFLLENAWIEAVQALPTGPAPVFVDDEAIQFTTLDEQPVPVTALEKPLVMNFEPDGSSGSVRWILRDAEGRASLVTLDGRLGRVVVEHAESVDARSLHRPPPITDEKEPVAVLESTKSATGNVGGRKK